MGCHFLLQRVFPTQGWNPKSLVSTALANGFLPLKHLGSPHIIIGIVLKYIFIQHLFCIVMLSRGPFLKFLATFLVSTSILLKSVHIQISLDWLILTETIKLFRDFPSGSALKNPLAQQEIWRHGLALSWEDPLEEKMATHSSNLAWQIPWTEEPGGLQSMGLEKSGHDWVTKQQQQLSFWL